MSGAPASPRLCALADLERTGAKGVKLALPGATRPLALLVVRRGQGVAAYIDRCPHIGTPLATFPDEYLDRETGELVCSTHGARFRIADGLCVRGPCRGRALQELPVKLVEGMVFLAEEAGRVLPIRSEPVASFDE